MKMIIHCIKWYRQNAQKQKSLVRVWVMDGWSQSHFKDCLQQSKRQIIFHYFMNLNKLVQICVKIGKNTIS